MFRRKTAACMAAILVIAVLGCAVSGFARYVYIGEASGYLSGTGDWEWIGADLYRGVQYKLTLSVPFFDDFDVKVVYDRDHDGYADSGETIASGRRGTGSDELVTFVPSHSGRYHIKVYSYSGSGFYTLKLYKWM